MSRFAKGNGANNNKKDNQVALSSDVEDDWGGGEAGRRRDARTRLQETTATCFTSIRG